MLPGRTTFNSSQTPEQFAADDEGNRLAYWYGRGGPDGVFRYYSIHALIVSAAKMRQGLAPDLPPAIFRDKKVIVGGSAAGLYDFKPTPFTFLEQYPGMEIQATLLSNLLNGHSVHRAPWWSTALLTVLLSFCAAWFFFRTHRVALSTLLIALVGALYAAVAGFLFRSHAFWLRLSSVLGMASTYALAAVVGYAVEGYRSACSESIQPLLQSSCGCRHP
jgi:adenylate cyclase